VPEIAVNEHRQSRAPKDKIRSAGKVAGVFVKSNSQLSKLAFDRDFE